MERVFLICFLFSALLFLFLFFFFEAERGAQRHQTRGREMEKKNLRFFFHTSRKNSHFEISKLKKRKKNKTKNSKKNFKASYRFDFGRVELPYESYSGGGAARLTYAMRASVKRPYGGSTAKEWGLAVRNAREQPPVTEAASSGAEINPTSTSSTSSLSPPTSSLPSPPIKMEVGIEDCLHIEFEYDKACYHLSDVVLGRISFLLVRIRLKHMELEVRRRETSGAGSNARSEATTLCKYEIMDGAPVRGETVPIRLCLAPYDLTPTYLNVHNKVKREREGEEGKREREKEKKKKKTTHKKKTFSQFSARYFLNLVLVDEEDRRYFKQQEITLWRKKGADERACGGGKGVGCCSGAAAAAAAAPAPPSVSPSAAAAAAVPPATPSAAAGTAPAAPAPQQPTEQLQMEEEAKEAAAPVEEEKREAAGGGGGGGEEEVKESEAAATTTDQEGEEREQERQQPAMPPAA